MDVVETPIFSWVLRVFVSSVLMMIVATSSFARIGYDITTDTLVSVPAAIPDTAAGQGEVFYVVEVMPNFIFGDRQGIEAFRNYVAMNLVYPADAQMNGIQGKVFVSFIVEVDGSVSNVKLVRSVNKLLDDVAIGAISASPRWKPGMHKGKPVRVNLTFPVNFKL